jgi:hypothetical protein
MLLEEASDDVMRDVESELRDSKESGASSPDDGEGRGPSTRPPDGGRFPAVPR